VSALAFKGIAEYLVLNSPGSPSADLRILDKVILCLVIFSAVEIVKSLAARVLSLRIHSEALFDSLRVLFISSRCLRLPGWHAVLDES
jgi:hypothetical protein